jgi:transcriptional regulator with XRE-family HTH domain
VEAPADDGVVAVHVDVLDLEVDGRVGGERLPTGQALLVAGPAVAVGRGPNPFHHAVVGDDVDESLGRSLLERLVELLDDGRGVGQGCSVQSVVESSNSSKGIAAMPAPRYHGGVTYRFPSHLRRWRTARRLSQLELAVRSGTTQRHLSFIEQGRSRPGRDIVARLAEALELSLRERNDLLLAAGFAPAFPESPLDDEALRPVRHALDTILDGHLPYPAMVVRPHGVLVTANRAFDLFHEGVDPTLLTPPVNVFRLALHPDGVASRVGNLPEWGRHITENLRTRLARSPDPSLEALLVELEGYLPPLPTDLDVLGFAVPLELESADGHLRLITTLTSFATAADVTLAELHLEAFLPADEATADVLRMRATQR